MDAALTGAGPAVSPAPDAARSGVGAALASPAAFLLLALLFVPSSGVLVLSLTDYRFGMPGAGFVGLANYRAMLDDPRVLQSLGNTARYVGVVAPLSIALGLLLAVLIEARGRTRGLFRSVFFLPVTATLVAMATAWEVLLHPSFGLVNAALAGLGLEKRRFLTDPDLALWSLAAIGVWKLVGYNVLLFVAGMATIPRDLYEAAAVDGADAGWKRFVAGDLADAGPGHPVRHDDHPDPRILRVRDRRGADRRRGPNGATDMMLYTLYEEAFRFFDIGHRGSHRGHVPGLRRRACRSSRFAVLDRRVHYV